MAEVEDQRPAAERGQHVIDLARERVAAFQQRERIEIALHRHPRLDLSRAKARSISLPKPTAVTPVSAT